MDLSKLSAPLHKEHLHMYSEYIYVSFKNKRLNKSGSFSLFANDTNKSNRLSVSLCLNFLLEDVWSS